VYTQKRSRIGKYPPNPKNGKNDFIPSKRGSSGIEKERAKGLYYIIASEKTSSFSYEDESERWTADGFCHSTSSTNFFQKLFTNKCFFGDIFLVALSQVASI
jgi:hypothetical protein